MRGFINDGMYSTHCLIVFNAIHCYQHVTHLICHSWVQVMRWPRSVGKKKEVSGHQVSFPQVAVPKYFKLSLLILQNKQVFPTLQD